MTDVLTKGDHIATIRWQRGWTVEDGHWVAPDGTNVRQWQAKGRPLPEHPGYDGFVASYWQHNTGHVDL
jgi:hypothetical protein